ncbi:hypothetical protein PAMP_014821 [Pampus punctatissimus]
MLSASLSIVNSTRLAVSSATRSEIWQVSRVQVITEHLPLLPHCTEQKEACSLLGLTKREKREATAVFEVDGCELCQADGEALYVTCCPALPPMNPTSVNIADWGIENVDACLSFLDARGVNVQGLSAEGSAQIPFFICIFLDGAKVPHLFSTVSGESEISRGCIMAELTPISWYRDQNLPTFTRLDS